MITRAHRPKGRVIHAVETRQVTGAPDGYTVVVTDCGLDLGLDYSEMPDDAPVTCRRCRAVAS